MNDQYLEHAFVVTKIYAATGIATPPSNNLINCNIWPPLRKNTSSSKSCQKIEYVELTEQIVSTSGKHKQVHFARKRWNRVLGYSNPPPRYSRVTQGMQNSKNKTRI